MVISTPTWTLRLDAQPIDVTTMGPRRDPSWSFTDAHGHEHTWQSDTFHRVQDDPDEPAFYIDEDGEEWNAPDHLECRVCGEHITPGMLGPDSFRRLEPGPVTATLAGRNSVGVLVTMRATDGEVATIRAAAEADRDAVVLGLLDLAPADRVLSQEL